MKKLNLAIIGQGRSGKDIHGVYYVSDKNEYYNVKYVVDADARRREISKNRYPGCEVFDDYKKLFDKKDIDVVINASYSYMHFDTTKDLLEHGFNVLVEKPFCRNTYECNTLINLAKKNNLLLTVFQQTFFAPYYEFTKELMHSGKIGEIQQVSIRFNGFSRRWDWQTLQKMMGGNSYNTGPHPIGIAVGLLDFDKNAEVVFSTHSTTEMSSGDSDDFVKIIMKAPNKPVIDIEINNTDAYCDYNVKLQGSRGTCKATVSKYKMKYVIPGENPERPCVAEFLQDAEGNPLYCSEKLITHEEEGTFDGTAFDVGTQEFYKDMYFALTEGRPLRYTADEYKQVISVIEKVHADNPLTVKF
ncbi:MAG: Gfo/Idh/MocA family oxidoreductase [Clostridia bacterium]|nr:Gfo/Idh/MocA family oxidoreductase [Clostridia bacterium]